MIGFSKKDMFADYRKDDFRWWLLWQKAVLKSVAAIMLVFTAYRLIYFFSFKNGKGTEGMLSDVAKSFATGLRFDLLVALYCCLPLIVLGLAILVVFSRRGQVYQASVSVAKFYLPFILLAVGLFCVVDFYFCSFFQSHLNILFFGIVNDDTKAVMQFVYDSYPLITIIVCSIVCFFVLYKIVVPWFMLNNTTAKAYSSLGFKIFSVVAFFLLAFLGIRGTLPLPDSFPLRIDHATVSSNTFINAVALNPLFSFKEAWSDKKEQSVERDMGKVLAASGFASVEEAYNFYTNKNVRKVTVDSLFGLTPYNAFLEKNKPNVIVIQMESMSRMLFDFHNRQQCNLLGELEYQLPSCYSFMNSVSCQNGTNYTLEGLMVNVPQAGISQSPLMKHSFSGACALPFYTAGYQTNFITGAKLGWRNIEQFVPSQYFSAVEGDAAIAGHVAGTQSNEWGAYDEFLFERTFQVLSSSAKPSFIFSMTTTNHPRFELPARYKPLPVALNKELKEKCSGDTEMLLKNMATFQYANNCLGNFIKRVKESPLGKNTIIVATGDHNIPGLLNYSDAELLTRYAVPIIMYMPDAYKPGYAIDTNRYVSHKDIFPSVYAHALSNATYFNLGNDFLSPIENTTQHFFSLNADMNAFNDKGAYILPQKLFFDWKDERNKILQPAKKATASLDRLQKRANAYLVLANYYLYEEGERAKKSKQKN